MAMQMPYRCRFVGDMRNFLTLKKMPLLQSRSVSQLQNTPLKCSTENELRVISH
jgi:hypothetical protein